MRLVVVVPAFGKRGIRLEYQVAVGIGGFRNVRRITGFHVAITKHRVAQSVSVAVLVGSVRSGKSEVVADDKNIAISDSDHVAWNKNA